MAVRRLDTKVFPELHIVSALARTGYPTFGDYLVCCTVPSLVSEVDWLASSPFGLGNEGEGTRHQNASLQDARLVPAIPAIPANAVTMCSPDWPK